MGGSRGAGFMITRTRGNRWRTNFDFTVERAECPNHVILSAVRTTRSEVLTESKDPLPLSAKMDVERHFDNGSMGRTPCHAGAYVELQGVLRLRGIIRERMIPLRSG